MLGILEVLVGAGPIEQGCNTARKGLHPFSTSRPVFVCVSSCVCDDVFALGR